MLLRMLMLLQNKLNSYLQQNHDVLRLLCD